MVPLNGILRYCRGVSRMRFGDQRSAEPTGQASAQTPPGSEAAVVTGRGYHPNCDQVVRIDPGSLTMFQVYYPWAAPG